MALTRYLKVRLSEEDYNAFKELAREEGTTVSTLMRQAVREMNAFTTSQEWTN